MKTYQETLTWLLQRLPMYQRTGPSAYRPGLDGISTLASYLGNPQRQFQSIHVAGTNGKGSTSHMLASVLQQSGYKVGLYTSPHLKDFSERIRIDGKPIHQSEIVQFVNRHKTYFETAHHSFFEMTVAMAFDRFANHQVEVAVIEVGLGGRLDATNIIQPLLSIITNIGLDHTQFLGNTRAAIAKEKAGIIKPKTTVVIGEKDSETQAIFEAIAQQQKAPLFWSKEIIKSLHKTDLLGAYQRENIRLVQAAFHLLPQFKVSEKQLKEGLKNVIKNTGLLGRWQIMSDSPLCIADVAHNKEGLRAVVKQLIKQRFDQLHVVLGFVQEKNPEELLSFFPAEAKFYLCAAQNPRALTVEEMARVLKMWNRNYTAYTSVREAFCAAQQKAQASDLIFIGGSTFVVAEVL